MTGEGTGLAYRGSFSYHCGEDFPTIEAFESTSFGGGRIVATEENPEVQYFLTDHIGSVRVVATDKDNVLERNDYQPFGKRWNTASMPVADNRDRFNGKEDQAFVGLPFSDYGARMYDPERGRWFTQDPKAEDYLSVSQYAFCLNNPIYLIDLDGMAVYFSQDGFYLGDDGNMNDEIRVINDQVWNMLRKEDGTIDPDLAAKSSCIFSEAAISEDSALRVYNYYNFTGYAMIADSNFDLSAGDMFTHQETLHNKSTGQYFPDTSSTYISVNIARNRKSGLYNNVSNLRSSIEHEYKHILDAELRPAWFANATEGRKEISAIQYQIASPTFQNVTPQYSNRIFNYFRNSLWRMFTAAGQ